jgi:HEAT repeat protein
MDQSPTFARHFARLLWLLENEAGNVDEQKMSLRALTTVCRLGPVTLRVREGRLAVNRHLVPAALNGVPFAIVQFRAHGVEKIKLEKATPARELLGFLKLLAAPGKGGAAFGASVAALEAPHIEIEVTATDDLAEAPTVITSAPVPPAAQPAATPADTRAAEKAAALMEELSAKDVTKLTPEELFRALDRAKVPEATAKVLDDMAALAEHSVRVAKAPVVAAIVHEIVSREAGISDAETKRLYTTTIKRLAKPALLRAVAALIPKRPERKQQYYEILARAGEEGAEAVIEQVNQAPTAADRKQLMDVFRELDMAVPALIRMLGDSRWFVVRNAADLLGELVAVQAEEPLIAALRHQDDRVRRAATGALLKLGTPDAMRRVYDAVNDDAPEVRMQVAAALSGRRDKRTSATLIRAIEDEQDGDVQLALIAALGRVGTPEAVQRLVQMAEPEGRLFRRKDTALRVAAVQALGEARTPAAVAALKSLLDDKERDVRETANRALVQAVR